MSFLLGLPIFRGYVKFPGCRSEKKNSHLNVSIPTEHAQRPARSFQTWPAGSLATPPVVGGLIQFDGSKRTFFVQSVGGGRNPAHQLAMVKKRPSFTGFLKKCQVVSRISEASRVGSMVYLPGLTIKHHQTNRLSIKCKAHKSYGLGVQNHLV